VEPFGFLAGQRKDLLRSRREVLAEFHIMIYF
jgi:hypothetical protein